MRICVLIFFSPIKKSVRGLESRYNRGKKASVQQQGDGVTYCS